MIDSTYVRYLEFKFIETEVGRGCQRRNGELACNWHRILLWNDEKVLEMMVVMTVQPCEYT